MSPHLGCPRACGHRCSCQTWTPQLATRSGTSGSPAPSLGAPTRPPRPAQLQPCPRPPGPSLAARPLISHTEEAAAFPQQRGRESTARVPARSAPLEPSPPGLGTGRVHGKTPKPAAWPVRAASRRSNITSPKKLEEKHLHNRGAESDRHPVSQETAGEDSGALRDKTHQPPFLTL